MPAVEVKFPHILTHGVSPDAAAGAVADVVVYFPIVNERAVPFIIVAPVSLTPDTIFDVRIFAGKMINGQTAHDIRALRDYGTHSRLDGSIPWGDTVVDKISKIRLRVVHVRYHKAESDVIGDRDTVAQQPAMGLNRTR